jgi:hypothetical protein
MATRIATEWGGAIKRYTDFGQARCKWQPAEPQEGSFHVAVAISEDTALAVQTLDGSTSRTSIAHGTHRSG